jgi:hypothetical protein
MCSEKKIGVFDTIGSPIMQKTNDETGAHNQPSFFLFLNQIKSRDFKSPSLALETCLKLCSKPSLPP